MPQASMSSSLIHRDELPHAVAVDHGWRAGASAGIDGDEPTARPLSSAGSGGIESREGAAL